MLRTVLHDLFPDGARGRLAGVGEQLAHLFPDVARGRPAGVGGQTARMFPARRRQGGTAAMTYCVAMNVEEGGGSPR